MLTPGYNRAKSVIIKNAIILNIMHDIFNIRDTDVFKCKILVDINILCLIHDNQYKIEGSRGRDSQLPLQSVSIIINVVSSNPTQTRCTRYNIMLKIVSMTCGRSVVFSGYSGFLHQ